MNSKLFNSSILILLLALFVQSCKIYVPEYTTIPEMYKLKKGMTKDEVNKTLGIRPSEFYTTFNNGYTTLLYKYKKRYQKIKKDSIYEPGSLANGGMEYFKDIGNLYVLFNSNDETMEYFMTSNGIKNAPPIITESRELREMKDSAKVYVKKKKGTLPNLEEDYYLRQGYSGSVEATLGSGLLGIKLYNGYSFGVNKVLSLGIGLENLSPINNPIGLNINLFKNVDSLRTVSASDYNGLYIPISIRYTVDLSKLDPVKKTKKGSKKEAKTKKARPYFFGEIGYILNSELTKTYNINNNLVTVNRQGGPMGAFGFGYKFGSKDRVSFNLSFGLNIRSYWIKETFIEPLPSTPNSGWRVNLNPTIGLGIGF
jgi:outer membrane protein assembly factor BamE (lipoprotein component of BamABCDE complex)